MVDVFFNVRAIPLVIFRQPANNAQNKFWITDWSFETVRIKTWQKNNYD